MIHYLRNNEIDRDKWDNCIRKASNGLIYAYSFYLDQMCEGWEALVLDDYTTVMPLTANRKFGFSYLYQPFLAAQLGVFGEIAGERVNEFIAAIPRHFRFVDISLNAGNRLPNAAYARERANYILDLRSSYDDLKTAYRDHVRRNLKKAIEAGLTNKSGIDVNEVVRLALDQMNGRDKHVAANVEHFRKLYAGLQKNGMAKAYGVFQDSQLLASAVFFKDEKRAYYILVGNDRRGKNSGASHALIDAFIRDHAGRKLLLDFEGSDIESLAFFYSSFGAVKEIYPAIKINRLPWWAKWAK